MWQGMQGVFWSWDTPLAEHKHRNGYCYPKVARNQTLTARMSLEADFLPELPDGNSPGFQS